MTSKKCKIINEQATAIFLDITGYHKQMKSLLILAERDSKSKRVRWPPLLPNCNQHVRLNFFPRQKKKQCGENSASICSSFAVQVYLNIDDSSKMFMIFNKGAPYREWFTTDWPITRHTENLEDQSKFEINTQWASHDYFWCYVWWDDIMNYLLA